MSRETARSDEISPPDYVGSTLGNAYFSGVEMAILFEAVIEISKESGSDQDFFASFDDAISAAIQAKEWLEEVIPKNGHD